MGMLGEGFSIEQFENVISILHPCIDDYIYIMDFKANTFCISENALNRFSIPESKMTNAIEKFASFVYAEDLEVLFADIRKIREKEQTFHNLRYRWLDKENNLVWINCRGNVITDEEGNPAFLIGCINEIGEKPEADNVSGLLGEASLKHKITENSDKWMSGFMLRIGIDDFKEITENKGMEYGNMILKKTAECMQAAAYEDEMIYRIVADEFIILDFTRDVQAATELYKGIKEKVDSFIKENKYEFFYTISAGVVDVSNLKSQSYDRLMRLSEFALNKAKAGGKNSCYVYVNGDYNDFLQKRELTHILRRAVNNNFEGFEAYFQPIIDIQNHKLSGAETLLRFQTKETGPVSPAEFIPLLEESGLIIPVGKWVLNQALAACHEIQKEIPDFKVSVNVSYIQVLRSNMLKEIQEAVAAYDLPKGSVTMELTESGFLESDANFIDFCDGLRESGIPLVLDDFGTGYSNFHYLYNLNPETIKIDRSFTMKALSNGYEYNLLQHMVEMSHDVDLKLCIEGIETQQELEKICGISPDYIQGFYFGKPCPLNLFLEKHIKKE